MLRNVGVKEHAATTRSKRTDADIKLPNSVSVLMKLSARLNTRVLRNVYVGVKEHAATTRSKRSNADIKLPNSVLMKLSARLNTRVLRNVYTHQRKNQTDKEIKS